jgi:L-ascorbate metabolism protein UlaG (beta-lactamase superfamily)
MDRMTWLGHSTVFLESAGQQILTDPMLRAGIGPVRRRPRPVDVDLTAVDAVLISHLHHDHLDRPSLRQLPRTARLVVPRGGGRVVRSLGFAEAVEVDAGDSFRLGDVEIEVVPALPAGRRMPFGPTGATLGYVIRGDSNVYFAGDTDLFPEMIDIAPSVDIDLAIVPVGGWGPTLRGGHMDPLRAAASLKLLHPRRAVAVHWGTLWPVGLARFRRERFEEPARDFLAEARRIAPEVEVIPLDPGGSIDIPASQAPSADGG